MKYRVEWTLSGSSEVEADNALDAALVRLGTVEEMERLNNEMAKDDH